MAAKEPKWASDPELNKMELVKLDKDGLDVINDIINTYSKQGYDSIVPTDMDLFK